MKESKNDSLTFDVLEIYTSAYDGSQGIRKIAWNQIRAILRRRNENLPAHQRERKKRQKNYGKEYKDNKLLRLMELMFAEGKLTKQEHEKIMGAIALAKEAASSETKNRKRIGELMQEDVMWNTFFVHVRGINVLLAGKLRAKFRDCSRFSRVSKLWRFCGYHLVCPKCTEEHKDEDDKMRTYSVVANAGDGRCPECGSKGVAPKAKRGVRNDYHKKLRMLVWNVATSLVKQRSPVYFDIYFKEKERQLERVFNKGELEKLYGKPYEYNDTVLKPKHAISRAVRKLAKIFLQHYWEVSRTLAGLSVTGPYVRDKLEHEHIITWKDVLESNGAEPPKELVA